MKKLILPIAIFIQLGACSSDDSNSNPDVDTRCGEGQAVTAGDTLACVYRNELIEEGFTCPTIVPTAFLLSGGGVACVAGNLMPEPLGQRLGELGYTPTDAACFGATPAATCYFTQPAPIAFDLTGVDTISYEASGGFGFCIDEGKVLDFVLNLSTLSATIGVSALGDEATQTCLSTNDGCIIRNETELTLTQAQADVLLALVGDVPAPMCVEDAGRVCDFCLIETVSANEQSVNTACCGETTEGFGPSIQAIVAYLEDLIPEPTSAFTNPTTFDLLTYKTGPGLGYCVDDGIVLSATITRSAADQSLSIAGFEAVLGDAATDTCIEDTTDGNCYVSTPFGPMTLGQAQQDALELALGAMPAPMCIVDPGLACDPCRITSIDLDGTVADDSCCGSTSTGYDNAFAAVVTTIDASH